MGRPRKRRRVEAGDTAETDGEMGDLEGEAVGAADVGFQDLDLTIFSGCEPGLGTDDFHLPNGSFERLDMVSFEAGSRPNLANIEPSSLDLREGPASHLEQGFPDWDPSQDLASHFSTSLDVPLQLQNPLNSHDQLDSNSHITEVAEIGCSCLSNLYSMLAKFQSVPSPSFPYSMGILKTATALSRSVVACHTCSQTYNTALQNSMLLGTLLQLLIMEYAKLLNHIDERSKQAEKIAFRLGDPSSLYDSRHTGLPDCPMAINVDLSGDEWRTLARKAVAQEVLGSSQGTTGLTGLVQQMKTRQVSWRERISTGPCTAFLSANHQHSAEHPDHLCVHAVYIEALRKSLQALGL